MWLGMRYKMRTMRIVSLTLFSLTLIKLFTYRYCKYSAGGQNSGILLPWRFAAYYILYVPKG
jgi:hypothetical protein